MLALRMRPERSGDLESKSGRTMRYMPAIGEETRQRKRGKSGKGRHGKRWKERKRDRNREWNQAR